MMERSSEEQEKILAPFWHPPVELQRLKAASLKTVQINLGRKCNQACSHCHMAASPGRSETMAPDTARQCLEIIRQVPSLEVVDLTGGAPELHEMFRFLVQESVRAGKRVIDRCNLTVLFEPGQEDLAEFLRRNRIEIVASLPALNSEEADSQRGSGVFYKSIEALQMLNDMGYGTRLPLHLVYNPTSLSLAGNQTMLEQAYRRQLGARFGIRFTGLYAFNNMPLSRFLDRLVQDGQLALYMEMLEDAYNRATVPGLMCRTQISIGYDGRLYDCDFNQMLDLQLDRISTVWDFDMQTAEDRFIITRGHCLGCTAGAGSSCGGSLLI